MARTFVSAKTLFTGLEDEVRRDQTMVIEDGAIAFVGPAREAPAPAPGDRKIDAGAHFVMPGLIDVHTHLAFGNARSEEDIDLFVSDGFRALRGLYFVQHCLAAGYTGIVCPGDAEHLSISVRDAIGARMFPGPRIAASSRVISNRQSLNDWFPSWVGTPDYFTGKLVTTKDEMIAEVRKQAKDGVDVMKIAMDGPHFRENGEHIAAFTQDETRLMVDEIHRLGKKAIVHAYGREAVLYAARAGVDVIFHAFYLDDACIEAILDSGSHLAPTFTFLVNTFQFARDHEPGVKNRSAGAMKRHFEAGVKNLLRAKEAGVPFMTGSDSGFAATPYGEWHARELEIFVEHMGFTPAEAIRCATSVSAKAMPRGAALGALAPGRKADFLFIDGSPLAGIRILQDRARIKAIYLGGEEMKIETKGYDPNKVCDFSTIRWSELYTRARVREWGLLPEAHADAAQ